MFTDVPLKYDMHFIKPLAVKLTLQSTFNIVTEDGHVSIKCQIVLKCTHDTFPPICMINVWKADSPP